MADGFLEERMVVSRLRTTCVRVQRQPIPELRRPDAVTRDIAFMQLVQFVEGQRKNVRDVLGIDQGCDMRLDALDIVAADAVPDDVCDQHLQQFAMPQPQRIAETGSETGSGSLPGSIRAKPQGQVYFRALL